MILDLQDCLPGGGGIASLIDVIQRGGTIAYPAETMYGIGGDGENRSVVEAVRRLKRREKGKGMIVLASSAKEVERRFGPLRGGAALLARRYWPGPLTLLLRDPTGSPAAAKGKIAVRVPDSPYLAEWIRLSGRLLLSTSANEAGEAPMTESAAVRTLWSDRVDLLVLGPSFSHDTLPSTVVDASVDPPRIVRRGCVIPVELAGGDD